MLRIILIIIFIILGNCSGKEKEYHPRAVVIFRTGDVRTTAKSLALGDEITDTDLVMVGGKSVCDLQMIGTETLAVIRIKEYSKFKLKGVQVGFTKTNNFIVDSGSAMLNVSKLGRNEEVNASTPTLTAGVRGTKYDLNVAPNGNSKVNVVEGSVSMKVRVPELEKYSRTEIKQSKTLSAVDDALESKEIVIESGKSSQVPKSVSTKILKDTGLETVIKKDSASEVDKDVDPKAVEEKLEKLEKEDLNNTTSDIDQASMTQKLKEYEELTPIEKEIINDKEKRKSVIKARSEKLEKSWLQRLLDWSKNIKF
ncbi:MAG TPA: FecR domain-containing protein [Leptospiraceae bacterium]|nr:FecR domain-containing protein [Leptospiraceae bacterium]HMX35411.1 FecR domain-containing protein [Leptospiraceae bacterium]HMY29479.1 FecR domain-containing protein [Leptospiraceae bacterium]HMZ64767.1 FecR domain-containing protein [Leptospiraceae bacterium]HNA10250.1 FecR domain-containing protein [Leptospiraceae bacterium]